MKISRRNFQNWIIVSLKKFFTFPKCPHSLDPLDIVAKYAGTMACSASKENPAQARRCPKLRKSWIIKFLIEISG